MTPSMAELDMAHVHAEWRWKVVPEIIRFERLVAYECRLPEALAAHR